MAKFLVTIKGDKCKGCGLCVHFCPKHVLEIGTAINEKGYAYAAFARPDDCIGCATCGIMCPDCCIEVFKEED